MKIVIKGTPIAKSRHRCGCRHGKPVSYDPQVKAEMAVVQAQMQAEFVQRFNSLDKSIALEASQLAQDRSLEVRYTFAFPVLKSETLARQNAKLWGLQPHVSKPDFDNLEKFYTDCGNGILWPDDALITYSSSKKIYDANPRTEIEIIVRKELRLCPKTEGVFLVFSPCRLKEILDDMADFYLLACEEFENITDPDYEDKEETMTMIANRLADFADKYVDELKKVKKFKGAAEERNDFKTCLKEIKSGVYGV